MHVWLWREAAVVELQLGSPIRLSHLKRKESSYGPQLHTTRYTRFEVSVFDPVNTSETYNYTCIRHHDAA